MSFDRAILDPYAHEPLFHKSNPSAATRNGNMAYNGRCEDFGEFNYQVPVFPRGESEQDAFMTSAPGKVIVFGEHAVVHGKVYLVFSSRTLQLSLSK